VDDPTDLSGQAARSRRSEDARALRHKRDLDDVRWLMEQARGRRFVWCQLERAGVYRTSMTGNSYTYFNEGRRDVGLQLLLDINEACPESFLLMLQEQRDSNDRHDHDTADRATS
jgi:hypothetical protein